MASEYPALTKFFLDAIDRFANPRAQMYRTSAGWQSISAQEMLRRVAGLSKALAELGIVSGDRVGLFAPNCPEWHTADFAIQGLGAVTVPIYFNESHDRLVYILNDSGARVVFTAGAAQGKKISECRSRIPALEHVISAAPDSELNGDILRYETLIASTTDADVAEYRRRAAEITGNNLATIIYTSGTTGEPKGVMLSHSNLSSNAIDSASNHQLLPSDVALEFLPLAHVYERTAAYSYICNGVAIAYLERIEDVPQALLEVHPTVTCAVPRFFEKIYANILEKGRRESGIKRNIFDWSLRVAEESVPWRAYGKSASPGLKLRWRVADALVYSKIREGLGGGTQRFSAGGAPLAPELAEFFWSVGVTIHQGYGLTETSPVVTANTPAANKIGTVGRPIPNVQVKIAEDGEILVKGPNVMQGYYHKPEATREVFTSDGWFRTGDIGVLDTDGYLGLTGRIKEIINRGGEKISPQEIEAVLLGHPAVAEAAAFGVPDTKYGEEVCAAVVLKGAADMEGLKLFCQARLADFKVPKMIWITSALPKNATGKIERRALPALFQK